MSFMSIQKNIFGYPITKAIDLSNIDLVILQLYIQNEKTIYEVGDYFVYL